MDKVPLILLPGTLCDERLWEKVNLSKHAEVKVCDVSKADTIEGMAKSVLEKAPDKFALAGLSLGGIISLEIMRFAPDRVMKLALLDTIPILLAWNKSQAGRGSLIWQITVSFWISQSSIFYLF